MRKDEKEVLQHQLDSEKAILKELEKQYKAALEAIDEKVAALLGRSDANLQHVIFQIEHQKALRRQIEGVLNQLHSNEFDTISDYLANCYEDGFIGSMYSMHNQGIPVIVPIDQNEVTKAVVLDSKINEGLYESIGVDVGKMKKSIRSEITRGISAGMSYNEIARNISKATKAPLSRAKTIVYTEGHRVQQASNYDGQRKAKSKGADVVKQWNSILDGNTRPTHRKLDGQIREVEEPFEMDGKKAMYPGEFGDPAEDCNCRCVSMTRARWALDEEELQTLKDRAEYFGLDKSESFADFQKKFLKLTDEWASADAKAKEYFGVDARDELGKIVARGTTKIKQGIAAFPDDDVLKERTKLVEPDGNKFDVAMHGTPTAVCFGSRQKNMSPRLLASIIRHSEGYHGQDIRLLSCSTGVKKGEDYCFAEELANALGVKVFAPNDLIYFNKNGTFKVRIDGSGELIEYKPNERGRVK